WGSTAAGSWSVRVYALVAGNARSFDLSLRPLLADGDSSSGNVVVSRWDGATSHWVNVISDTFAVDETKTITVPNTAAGWLCRIRLESSDIRFFAPITPFPEVAVLRKVYFNGRDELYASYGVERQDWWVGTLDTQPAELTFEGVRGFYDLPAF